MNTFFQNKAETTSKSIIDTLNEAGPSTTTDDSNNNKNNELTSRSLPVPEDTYNLDVSDDTAATVTGKNKSIDVASYVNCNEIKLNYF